VTRPAYLQDLRDHDGADGSRQGKKQAVSPFSFTFQDVPVVDNASSATATPRYVHNGDQSGTCTFNGLTYDRGSPLLTVVLGVVQEWTVDGVHAHPLHVHVNPLQVQSFSVDGVKTDNDCDDEYGFLCVGDWVDTLQVPNPTADSAGAVVRFKPVDFTGDMVIHCHYLIHEDQGCLTFALMKQGDDE
jgi:FtsP/CotA-like multicopper oxidase with cupredoxin domain